MSVFAEIEMRVVKPPHGKAFGLVRAFGRRRVWSDGSRRLGRTQAVILCAAGVELKEKNVALLDAWITDGTLQRSFQSDLAPTPAHR